MESHYDRSADGTAGRVEHKRWSFVVVRSQKRRTTFNVRRTTYDVRPRFVTGVNFSLADCSALPVNEQRRTLWRAITAGEPLATYNVQRATYDVRPAGRMIEAGVLWVLEDTDPLRYGHEFLTRQLLCFLDERTMTNDERCARIESHYD